MTETADGSVSGINAFFDSLNLSKLSIPSIRVSDIIDIIIVAIFIYIIMNWIRETRAWSLFKGMIVILILSVLSFRLNFYTTYWIIQETFSVGVIAILILFQPEFRKGLEQIGKGSLTKTLFNNNTQDQVIQKNILDEILTACFNMGKTKTGAIIVVEQKVALGDFEESGVPIDAVITSQLLINIFQDKTPLHDGAVLIRNNRIKRAACILPLTQSEIGLDLGTRHRASVGASEVTDAYIFVVSEETGAVSIAHNGKLYRNLTKQQIEEIFTNQQKQINKKINIWKGRG